MIQHLKILITLIVFIYGLWVTFYINNVRKKFNFSYLTKIAQYNICFNVIFLFQTFITYFKLNLPEDFLLNQPFGSHNFFILIPYFLIYLMFRIVIDFFEKKITKKQNLIILTLFLIAFTMETLNVFNQTIIQSSFFLNIFYEYFIDNLILLEFLILVFLGIVNKKNKIKSKKKIINSFVVLFLIRYLIFLIIFLIAATLKSSKLSEVISMFTGLMIINMIPFFWVKYSFLKYAGILSEKQDIFPLLNEICISHRISQREREIIILILEGKTNKEIEDTLYISIHTVKNHIYKIFRKLNINSRHQLVKYFSFK